MFLEQIQISMEQIIFPPQESLIVCLEIKIRDSKIAGGSVAKNPPAMQEGLETWVWSLGQEYPLEKEMAAHSNILAWKIPWTEDPGGCSPWGYNKLDTIEWLHRDIIKY